MTQTYFNPGCALSIYKPDIGARILSFLNAEYAPTLLHEICCRHEPRVPADSVIVNVCAGCDRRFRSLYEGVTTISLWEVLDSLNGFAYPDHTGLEVSVHDPCPVRERPQVHDAVRLLLARMNITIVETEQSRERSLCCGDDFYPALPLDQVHQHMKQRARDMPCNEVVVYCVSCIKSMHIGGKSPRHLIDLLFSEGTDAQVYETVEWHRQLQEYIDRH